jgi:BirA family biotin operon repressor/biotin-[acetyl-CoA-carboxylase] ligase
MASHSSLALLRVLADGEFHSGASLAAQFNMTRAGVHHHIDVLRGQGVPFEGVPKKGYRIPGGMSLLDEAGLAESLPGIDIHYHDTLPSTQDYLLPIARQKPTHPILCVTECQTKGRGRGSKSWHAPLGAALCFSICVVINKPMQALSGFTLALGVALRESLAELGATDLQLKWPNDLFHASGAKLAGILTEAFGDMDGPTRMVIGIGLNVKVPAVHMSMLDQPWTDLQSCMTDSVLSRQSLLIHITQSLLAACDRYEREGFEPFRCLYNQHDYLKGKTIGFQEQDVLMKAVVQGVGESGELLIDRPPFKLIGTAVKVI